MSSEAANELIKTLCQIAALMLTPVIFFISSLIFTLLKRSWQKDVVKEHPDVSIQQALAALDPDSDPREVKVSKEEAYALIRNAIQKMQKENRRLKCQEE